MNSSDIKIFVNSVKLKMINLKIFYENEDNFLSTPQADAKVGTVAIELYIRNKKHVVQNEIANSDTFILDNI